MRKNRLKAIISAIMSLLVCVCACGVYNAGALDSTKKYVCLTFDDGPNTDLCVKTLDILKEKGVAATFFVVGNRITSDTTPIMQRIIDEGHQVGLHSWGHNTMGSYTIEQVYDDIDRCQQAIYSSTGKLSTCFRYPSFIMPTTGVARQVRYPVIGQNCYGSATCTPSNGGVILMHCTIANDIAILPDVIDNLIDKGYGFLTVDQMREYKNSDIVYGSAISTFYSGNGKISDGIANLGEPMNNPNSTLENGVLTDFDTRSYSYNQNQGSVSTDPSKTVKLSYCSDEGYSNSGNSLKFSFPEGETNKYRFASLGLSNMYDFGLTSEATGIKFWAKAGDGETISIDKVGINSAVTSFTMYISSVSVTDVGGWYYLSYKSLGIFSGDDISNRIYFNFYINLFGKDNKSLYIDDISLYGVGQPQTTTLHTSQSLAPTTSFSTVSTIESNSSSSTATASSTVTTSSKTTTVSSSTIPSTSISYDGVYPSFADCRIKKIVKSYDDYDGTALSSNFKDSYRVGSISDGTAFKGSSLGIAYKNGDNCWVASYVSLGGDGFAFWYKSSSSAVLQMNKSYSTYKTINLPSAPNGRWYTVMYEDNSIDYSAFNHLCIKYAGSDTFYFDELLLFEKFKKGDTNNDGFIDAKDVLVLKKHLAKWSVDLFYSDAADVNSDGRVNIADVLALTKTLI